MVNIQAGFEWKREAMWEAEGKRSVKIISMEEYDKSLCHLFPSIRFGVAQIVTTQTKFCVLQCIKNKMLTVSTINVTV